VKESGKGKQQIPAGAYGRAAEVAAAAGGSDGNCVKWPQCFAGDR